MRWLIGLCTLLLSGPGPLAATDSNDSIWQRNFEQMFARDRPRRFARTPADYFEYLQTGEGFYTQLAATTVYQHASSSLTDRDQLLNASFDLGGAVEVLDRTDNFVSGISWWIRGGTPIGASKDADLSRDIGAVQDINSSLENGVLWIKDLFWAHQPATVFRYSLGWVATEQRYDYNDAAGSEREQFIADSLNNSPTVPFPESGLGADGSWLPDPTLTVHGGLFQANCNKHSWCLEDLQSGEYFAPLEVRYQPEFEGSGGGSYSLLGYYTETQGKRGGGVSLSIDQFIGRWLPFMRWSHGKAATTEFTDFLSLGLGMVRPFDHVHDEAGVAFARANPSDTSLDDETVVEMYYRFHVTNYVTATPDFMLVMNPVKNPDEDRIAVLGFRLQLDF